MLAKIRTTITYLSPLLALGSQLTFIMSNTEEGRIEADADATSDYESVKSDTTSVTSSIFNYVFENGHSYHAYKAGQYVSSPIKTYPTKLNFSSFCQTMNLSKGD
jgi:hypothetical protein